MTMKTKLIRGFLTSVVVSLLGVQTLQAESPSWSFVMMGDTRGHPHDLTTTGVSTYLPIIANEISRLHPDLVMVAGDMILGNEPLTSGTITKSPPDFGAQFESWKFAMNSVYDSGIAVYTVRGNHENAFDEGITIPCLKTAYHDAFGSYLPTNGPNDPTDPAIGNQVGYSYSFTHNNVTFVVADQYFHYESNHPGASGTTHTGYYDMDTTWINQQFQASTSPFKILMGHKPLFQTETGDIPSEQLLFGTSGTDLRTRMDFWNELGAEGVQLYLTGHVHNQTVNAINFENNPSIIQLMAGNGGANLDPITPCVDTHSAPELGVPQPNMLMLTATNEYGFSLAQVENDVMTISYHYYSQNADDTWTWKTSPISTQVIPEPSSLCFIALGMTALMAVRFRRKPVTALRCPRK